MVRRRPQRPSRREQCNAGWWRCLRRTIEMTGTRRELKEIVGKANCRTTNNAWCDGTNLHDSGAEPARSRPWACCGTALALSVAPAAKALTRYAVPPCSGLGAVIGAVVLRPSPQSGDSFSSSNQDVAVLWLFGFHWNRMRDPGQRRRRPPGYHSLPVQCHRSVVIQGLDPGHPSPSI